MSATIPALSMHVNADVTSSLPGGATGTLARASNTNGLGDVVLMPLLLNYNVDPDFNVNLRAGVYAPTGNYQVGRLANTGKNFWTIEPVLGLMYFGQKNGIEGRSSPASTSTPRTRIPTTSRESRSTSTARSPSTSRSPAGWRAPECPRTTTSRSRATAVRVRRWAHSRG